MNILIFTTPFYPRKSGLSNYVLNLSKKLIEKGFNITVLCYDTEKTEILKENIFNINVFRVKCKKILNSYYIPDNRHLDEQLKNIAKKKYDVVLTNTRFFHSSLIGMEFAKKNNISLIHVEHGSSFVQTNNLIIWLCSRIFDLFIGRRILNNANKIVSISEEVKLFVKKLSGKDSVVIYNSIDTKSIKPIKLTKKVKNLVFVGRLIYGKGVQDLINVFDKLNNKNLSLYIVGDGPYKNKLEDLAKRLNLENKIIFFGEVNRLRVIKILSKSDIFINPSYTEGLPSTILEAGLVGLPVIATDVGGTKEIIINKKTGLLINPKNFIELKNAITTLINNSERIKFAKNLNKLIRKKFDWELNIKDWEKILKVS